MSWFLQALRQYATFSGRARRKEYWYFVLFYMLIFFVLWAVDGRTGTAGDSGDWGLLSGVFSLAMLLPSIAVGVRRLHDTGRTGWWLLLSFIPLIGALILIYFMVQDGDAQTNAYGPNPKAP
jgi:uncharacterized membrane protein YhaH (DUF805 family)